MSINRTCRATHPGYLLLAIAAIAVIPAMVASGIRPVAAVADTCLHFVRLCLATLGPVDSYLHIAPVVLLLAGIARASTRRFSAVRRSRAIIHGFVWRRPRPQELLYDFAARHGVLPNVRIMLGRPVNPAFTAGLIWPAIYMSEVILQKLSEKEIEAVLLHEIHHLRRRDPLRTLMAGLIADMLFWIPLARNAVTALVARMEFAADDAARRIGDTVVAAAILKLADASAATAATASFSGGNLVERRVERLLGGDDAECEPLPRKRTLMLSACAIAFVWMIGVASSATHAAHVQENHAQCPHTHHLAVLHSSDHHGSH
jgi:beta-lactamase regulating signal transducer with metallopeptidase domain